MRLDYEQWIATELSKPQWEPYLLTFMFNHLPGSVESKLKQMTNEVMRFYSTLITRVLRKPNQKKNASLRPLFIASPDLPVRKSVKSSLKDVTVNDGLHYHALVFIPKDCRLTVALNIHINDNLGLYLGNHGVLRVINVKTYTHDPHWMADYVMKGCKRNPAFVEHVLLLPRSQSELRST
jgi:hypothetical protein